MPSPSHPQLEDSGDESFLYLAKVTAPAPASQLVSGFSSHPAIAIIVIIKHRLAAFATRHLVVNCSHRLLSQVSRHAYVETSAVLQVNDC